MDSPSLNMSEIKRPSRIVPPPSYSQFAPPVPSPLNPRKCSAPSPVSSHPTCPAPSSRPKPPRRSSSKKSRNESPTQKLLRQKAEMAWRSQTRMNVLMTSQEQLDFPVYYSSGLSLPSLLGGMRGASGGCVRTGKSTSGRRAGGSPGSGGGVYHDIMDHPNTTALLDDLEKDSPTTADTHSSAGGDVGPGLGIGFGPGLGLDGGDTDMPAANPSGRRSPRRGGYGTSDPSVRTPGGESSLQHLSSKSEEMSEKDALISEGEDMSVHRHPPIQAQQQEQQQLTHTPEPDLEAGVYHQQHGMATSQDVTEDGVPLLMPPDHRHHHQTTECAMIPEPERSQFMTPKKMFIFVALLLVLSAYPVWASVLPGVMAGGDFEFI